MPFFIPHEDDDIPEDFKDSLKSQNPTGLSNFVYQLTTASDKPQLQVNLHTTSHIFQVSRMKAESRLLFSILIQTGFKNQSVTRFQNKVLFNEK